MTSFVPKVVKAMPILESNAIRATATIKTGRTKNGSSPRVSFILVGLGWDSSPWLLAARRPLLATIDESLAFPCPRRCTSRARTVALDLLRYWITKNDSFRHYCLFQ